MKSTNQVNQPTGLINQRTNEPTNQQTNKTNKTVVKTILLIFLSFFLFLPSAVLAFDFDGQLKGITITDSASENIAPNAVITYTQEGTTFHFDGSGSSDPDGSILEYKWDFGDGTTATAVMASHTFTEGEDFPVTLSIVDDKGGVSLSQIAINTINNKICFDIPFITQAISNGRGAVGNFSNYFFRGTTYHGDIPLETCQIDIGMKLNTGDIRTKNFYVEIYSLDSNNNLNTLIGKSEPVLGGNMPDNCGMVSFRFNPPVIIEPNNAVVVSMDGSADYSNFADICYKAFNDLYLEGEFSAWHQNKDLNRLYEDGSDLMFQIFNIEK